MYIHYICIYIADSSVSLYTTGMAVFVIKKCCPEGQLPVV